MTCFRDVLAMIRNKFKN